MTMTKKILCVLAVAATTIIISKRNKNIENKTVEEGCNSYDETTEEVEKVAEVINNPINVTERDVQNAKDLVTKIMFDYPNQTLNNATLGLLHVKLYFLAYDEATTSDNVWYVEFENVYEDFCEELNKMEVK